MSQKLTVTQSDQYIDGMPSQNRLAIDVIISILVDLMDNLYWVNDTTLWESPNVGNWRSANEPNLILLSNTTIEAIASRGELMDALIWNRCTGDIFQECRLTDECAEMFVGKLGSQYSLTHQIFYFHFAKKVCKK